MEMHHSFSLHTPPSNPFFLILIPLPLLALIVGCGPLESKIKTKKQVESDKKVFNGFLLKRKCMVNC